MKVVEGNIVDCIKKKTFKGQVYFDTKIRRVVEKDDVVSDKYILPGFIDAHVHIESTMLSPVEYAKVAVKHGVIGAATDPHEIANVCGIEGVKFMVEAAAESAMKIITAAPSCVPATSFETAGASLSGSEIRELFEKGLCTHLGEMMDFPGVIDGNKEVLEKLEIARKLKKPIDGHAPQLNGKALRDYVKAGIGTDHECTSVHEALEKISLGMKIMLRDASGSNDFDKLISLIKTHSEHLMLCTDDKHPDLFVKEYIDNQVRKALNEGYSIYDILSVANVNANHFYKMDIGLLQEGDSADFVVADDLVKLNIEQTFIDGNLVWNKDAKPKADERANKILNNFYVNDICEDDLLIENKGGSIRIVDVVPGSLLTKEMHVNSGIFGQNITSKTEDDILKIVVMNRYIPAKAQVGFIHGFGLKKGAIAGSVAHDSHNIIAVGVSDKDLVKAIKLIQRNKGGLVAVNGNNEQILPLEIGGLMSNEDAETVAKTYTELDQKAKEWGSALSAPFMTLSFMALLVIPKLKIGDRGLFDVDRFEIVNLQV